MTRIVSLFDDPESDDPRPRRRRGGVRSLRDLDAGDCLATEDVVELESEPGFVNFDGPLAGKGELNF